MNKALSHRIQGLENRYTPAVMILYSWEYPDGQGAIGTREQADQEGITKLEVLRPLNESRGT